MSNLILSNKSNYKSVVDTNEYISIFNGFMEMTSNFLLHLSDKVYIRNEEYHRYIIVQGMNTMLHIFTQLFMYTRNIELTLLYLEKAYCFYVEFISQISDENNSYLKLTCKDAILFVYKKTIFDVNQEYRKAFELSVEESEYFGKLNKLTGEFNRLIINCIFNLSINNDGNSLETIENILTNVKQTITTLFDYYTNEDVDELIEELQLLNTVVRQLLEYEENIVQIFGIILTLARKVANRKVDRKQIVKNICDNYYDKLSSLTPLKFVNKII